MPRRLTLTSACIVLALSFALPAFTAEDAEGYRPQIEAIVNDPLTPEVELAAGLNAQGPSHDVNWPDAGVLQVSVNKPVSPPADYVIVDPATEKVVGYVAPDPRGPVPMNEISVEAGVEIAREFCGRHLPELFAEGGEVVVTAEEDIGRNGARMVRLRRLVQGVTMPTLADIGVRVYDGKVVSMRRKAVPLDAALQLPGALSLEQAQEAASKNVPWDNVAAVWCFDCLHEVILTDAGQRNVWTLWGELRTKNTTKTELEWFNHWVIDANTGEVISSEWTKPTEELIAAYAASGGPRAPKRYPPRLFADSQPIWSPDGTKLLFLSDRERPGYPSWMHREGGLFVINADGTGLKCVMPEPVRGVAWSRDSGKIACALLGPHGEATIWTVSLEGERLQHLPFPKHTYYTTPFWVDDARLFVRRVVTGVEQADVVLVDLTQPDAEPKTLSPKYASTAAQVPICLTPDGSAIIFMTWEFHGWDDQWDIVRAPLDGNAETAEVICEKPPVASVTQLLGPDTLFMRDPDAGRRGMWMVNMQTWEAQAWEPPSVPLPEPRAKDQRADDLHDLSFSPDGQRLAFVHNLIDTEGEYPNCEVIWTCALDGSDCRRVTPWE